VTISTEVRLAGRPGATGEPVTAARTILAGTFLAVAFAILASPAYADGNAAHGKEIYESRCIACHSLDANRVGPAHRGVFGRQAGTAADYEYSDALRHSKVVWNAATLDRWLTNPELLIPGQKMGYSVSDSQDRADVISYLKQESGR